MWPRSDHVVFAIGSHRLVADGVERHGWWLTVDAGLIVEVGARPPAHVPSLDLGDCDLLPGLVDLHSDCLEDRARPRRTMEIPLAAALLQLDAEVAIAGITTHFACVCLDGEEHADRSPARAREALRLIADLSPVLRATHLAHVRVELTGADAALDTVLDEMPVAMISYMDHTPGRGQYPDEADWRAFYRQSSSFPLTDGELDALVARRRDARGRLGDARRDVAATAHQRGAVLASHDDDDAGAVATAVALGARIAEFPVTAEAAERAHDAGLGVVMGAPNARRGRSHLDNLSARDALGAGLLDALASDYHPASLLAAVYQLADEGVCSWAGAVHLATTGPARLAGLADRGDLAPGMRADLVAVRRRADLPSVEQVWVDGAAVFGARPAMAVAL